MKSLVSPALSCEMPSTVTLAARFARYTRSRKGKAYWQTGQLTLKNTSTTGPLASASRSDTFPPCTVGKVKSGASTPALNAAIDSTSEVVLSDVRFALTADRLSWGFPG